NKSTKKTKMSERDTLEETPDGTLMIKRVIGKYGEYEYIRLEHWNGTIEQLRSFVRYYLTKVKTLQKHPLPPFDRSVLTEWAQEHFFPHQYEALDAAITKHDGRCIGALDMGMGKTLIGWAFAKHYGGDILILCPKITKKA